MEYRTSEVKAGVFIFFSLIALIVMIFFLGNLKERFTEKNSLPIVFNFTGGLEVGAPVRYAGFEVGRVAQIRLNSPEGEEQTVSVTVIAEIDPKIKIKRNSSAMVKTMGLMGGLYIDIRPGTKNSPLLKKGQPLMGQDSFEFTKIGDMMEEVVVQVRKFTDMADGLTADSRETLKLFQVSLHSINRLIEENRADFQGNLKNMSKVSAQLAEILEKNKANIEQTIAHVASASEKADHLISEKSKKISDVIDQTHHLTHEIDALLVETRPGISNIIQTLDAKTGKIISDIDSAAISLEGTLHQGNAILSENRRNLMELIKNLNTTSRHLKVLAEDLKLNPWKLIRKDDEVGPGSVKPTSARKGSNKIRMKRLDKVSNN